MHGRQPRKKRPKKTRPKPRKGIAHYKCLRCPRDWWASPGPAECKCGHLYVRWLNYDELFGDRDIVEEYWSRESP